MRISLDTFTLLAAASLIALSPTALAEHIPAPPNIEYVRATTNVSAQAFDDFSVKSTAEALSAYRYPLADPIATLVEDGESGTSGVIIDQGSSTYAVLQDTVATEGSFAFHLTNANTQNVIVEIGVPIAATADTKLFFESWLRLATPSQIAAVEISTDNGASWPDTVFSQAGNTVGSASIPTDFEDAAFILREISLAAYAAQSIRIRFHFLRLTGSFFSGSSQNVGWFVDNIQVGNTFNKRLYSIGEPTAEEQHYVELINRARADAAAEAQLLKNTTDPDVLSAINSFSVDLDQLVLQFATLDQTVQPVSINAKLTAAARLHSQDQFDNTFQGHLSSPTPPAPHTYGDGPSARATKQGYDWAVVGENVYAFSDSTFYGHAGFNIDWGFGEFGMQTPPGHRNTIHNNNLKEIGIGIVNGSNTGLDWTGGFASNTTVGPQIVTQDFARPQADNAFITGVIFDDADGDKFYDPGEGVGGMRVDVEGSVYYSISANSGGYSVPVAADGVYDVTFQAPGFNDYTGSVTISSMENKKIDWRRLKVTVVTLTNSESDLMSISYTAENHSPAATFKLLKSTTPDGTYTEVIGATPTGPVDGVLTFTYQRAPKEEVFFRVVMTD